MIGRPMESARVKPERIYARGAEQTRVANYPCNRDLWGPESRYI